jgi:hypothetical protein
VPFDARRIHTGELVAAGGAVLLLAALLLLPWFTAGAGGDLAPTAVHRVSLDGWHALRTIRWFLLVTVAVSGALLLLTASQRAPALPVVASMLTCVIGALSTLLVLFRIIHHPGLQPRVGVYIGALAAIAIGYGGYLSLRTESSPSSDLLTIETVPGERTRAGSGASTE